MTVLFHNDDGPEATGSDRAEAVEAVFALFKAHSGETFGEAAPLTVHMLQCAEEAGRDAARPALVVAALLHDIGDFLIAEGAAEDPRHEAAGAAWLAPRFGSRVAQAVASHVEAKRYLCAVDPAYFEGLSQASVLSLAAQGGPMSRVEAEAFLKTPGAAEAVRLRRWDDLAKDPSRVVPPLEAYRHLLMGVPAG